MFKHLTIYLEGPICECEHQDLSWRIERVNTFDMLEHHDLLVFCRTCDESILLVHEDFIATIELDEKYPKGRKPAKPKGKPPLMIGKAPDPEKEPDTAKVLSFAKFAHAKKEKDPKTENDKKPPKT